MSSTIDGISSAIIGFRPPPSRGTRPDLSKVADAVFGQLDTGNKGYVDKADLQNAVEQVTRTKKSGSGNGAPSADDLLKAFDSNGDGKITKQEFSDGTKRLAEQFESQFNRSRTSYDLVSGSASNEIFKQLDTGGKGYLDKTDLENAEKRLSRVGDANGAISADDLLKALDTDSDGKISKQEFSSAFEKLAKPSGPPPGPPPPRGEPGGPQATTSANSATTYEAADTNQNGTVSEPEQIAYEISSAYINSQPSSETNKIDDLNNAAADNRTRQILHFLQSYAQNTDTSVASQSATVDFSV